MGRAAQSDAPLICVCFVLGILMIKQCQLDLNYSKLIELTFFVKRNLQTAA